MEKNNIWVNSNNIYIQVLLQDGESLETFKDYEVSFKWFHVFVEIYKIFSKNRT